MDRFAIAKTLRDLGSLLALQGAPPFRAQAYARGAAALEAAEDFDRLLKTQRLTELAGIGAGLAAVINELATTGQSTLMRELQAQLPPGALELSEILGLEPMKKLHAALGVDSIDALEAACVAGKVRDIRGFGDKTEARYIDKIKAYRSRGTELLLADARLLAAELVDYLTARGADAVTIVGAIRRGLELVDRIELLAVGDTTLVDALASHPRVARIEPSTDPDTPTRAYFAEGVCIALWVVGIEDGLAELTHTGPPEHVAAVLARLPGGGHISFAAEREVYERAGMYPTAPELRDDPTMLDMAPRLIEATDIQGLVHCHTTWSDGRNSVAEMAQAAAARGLRYITITDHSQAAGYANGLDADRLFRQWDEIDRVQETTQVRILKGIESDILADGALDYPDAILERLDVVIASIHARHSQSSAEMTQRIVRMLRHPVRKIWGHPLGRMLQRRAPVECDLELILETAASTRTIIELNGDPHRMDLPVDLARRARDLGIPFVASVDAHATSQLGYLDNAITLARRAALPREQVLNTLDSDAFVAAVRPY